MHQDTDPQEPVHLAGREQLPVAGVVRSGGRQPAGADGERGKRARDDRTSGEERDGPARVVPAACDVGDQSSSSCREGMGGAGGGVKIEQYAAPRFGHGVESTPVGRSVLNLT